MTRLFLFVAVPMALTLLLLMHLRNMLPGTMVEPLDFVSSVSVELLDVRRVDRIQRADYAEHARGTYHILALEFTNVGHCDYRIENGSVVITDGQEQTIGVDLLAQALYEAGQGRAVRSIAPGQRAIVHFCFDVPSEFPQPRVEFEQAAFHRDMTQLASARETVFARLDEFATR